MAAKVRSLPSTATGPVEAAATRSLLVPLPSPKPRLISWLLSLRLQVLVLAYVSGVPGGAIRLGPFLVILADWSPFFPFLLPCILSRSKEKIAGTEIGRHGPLVRNATSFAVAAPLGPSSRPFVYSGALIAPLPVPAMRETRPAA